MALRDTRPLLSSLPVSNGGFGSDRALLAVSSESHAREGQDLISL